jgi:hypothetical protein
MSDRPTPISLEAFIAQIGRDRPLTLNASDLSSVTPQPWVLRAGSGKSARIRMLLGAVRYERQPGEAVWHLAQYSSDLDVEDVA